MTSAFPRALPEPLASEVRAWIAEDPDPSTRAELAALVEAGDVSSLEERFAEPLAFGTAGLRGALGAGPARMNRLVVRRTTAGVARWLLAKGGNAATDGIVVGRDARHGSAVFAADVVEVAASMGLRVRVLPQPLPTPLTAFAVLHYGAAAGVMVTASHNPAPDNGYKVYAADGAQIVPPDDELIAAGARETSQPSSSATAAAAAAAEATATAIAIGQAAGSATPVGLVTGVDRDELLEAYATAVLGVLEPSSARGLSVVYSPLHGVGGEVLPWLFERAGFARPRLVSEQAEPDPDFPTAPFPNPEEPGVLDLALAEAARIGADVVVVNDPDADRLAVALPDTSGRSPCSTAGWRVLSGDELGALLGSYLIERGNSPGDVTVPVVASSIVSSSLLAKIAAAAGVQFVETLTGFKWIARAADRVAGGRLVLGYEEALGYAVSPAVRDKDGLSAALLFAELAARARAAGRPISATLDDLDVRFGLHATSQLSRRLGGPDAHRELVAVLEAWRRQPPEQLGGLRVVDVVDLERGGAGLPATPGVVLRLSSASASASASAAGGDPTAPKRAGSGRVVSGRVVSGRVVVRPSGTEPKLKAYLEIVLPPLAPGSASDPHRTVREDGLDASLAGERRLAGELMTLLRSDVGAGLGR